MIDLLLALVVLVVVVYVIRLLLPLLGLPEPVTHALLLVVALVALIWFLQRLGLVGRLL